MNQDKTTTLTRDTKHVENRRTHAGKVDVIFVVYQLYIQSLLKANPLMNFQVYSKWTGVAHS